MARRNQDTHGTHGAHVTDGSDLTGSGYLALEKAIKKCDPTEYSNHGAAVFVLARELKAIPRLADASMDQLRSEVLHWHERYFPDGHEPFDETWSEFTISFDRVKYPAGSGPIESAWTRAQQASVPAAFAKYDCPITQAVIKLAIELTKETEDGEFFLACRTPAKLLGVDHKAVWKRLRMLTSDCVLVLIEQGKMPNASRYRLGPVC